MPLLFGLTKSRLHDCTVRRPRLHAVDSCAVVQHDRTTIYLRAVVSVRNEANSNLLLMFFPVSFNFKLFATLLLYLLHNLILYS